MTYKKNQPKIKRAVARIPKYSRAILNIKGMRADMNIGNNAAETGISTFTGEVGEDVNLLLVDGAQRIQITLTKLTSDELAAFKELCDIAFANAQPIVALRDQTAQEALDNEGDDSFQRLYRDVPKLTIREGTQWPHYPSIRRGSEWVPPVDTYAQVRTVNVRDDSSDLPERDEGVSLTGDHDEKAGGAEGVREVPRGVDLGGLSPAPRPEVPAPSDQ
jgi:hypothetical protein